ncbi:MAG: CmcJ/NvfI family oxidoreductase [Gammaproteobacteria bacterium]|nr:CmcJ/NvfI family oxidoreductase [Gammaproteobacteria bacterium]
MEVSNQFVATQVRYLAPSWGKTKKLPRIYDRDSRRANTEKVDVLVRDARDIADTITLDVNGFELFDYRSPISDFEDAEAITEVYRPAIAEFVRDLMGANEVFITNHLIRTEDKSDFNKAYARFVHCDYSLKTARSASLSLLKNRSLDTESYENAEFAWFNTWQPFDNPVQQNPLAVLDASTIQEGDIVDYVYGGTGKSSTSSMPLRREEHQFYYYRDMLPDEVLLIKQLDTRIGRARVSPHTSFVDPNSPLDALPRRSIEVRLMAVFK